MTTESWLPGEGRQLTLFRSGLEGCGGEGVVPGHGRVRSGAAGRMLRGNLVTYLLGAEQPEGSEVAPPGAQEYSRWQTVIPNGHQ